MGDKSNVYFYSIVQFIIQKFRGGGKKKRWEINNIEFVTAIYNGTYNTECEG